MNYTEEWYQDELTIIQDKQWQHYLLLSQLSEYHFLFNLLLIVISILQITVANETALKEAEANPEESQSLTVSKRQSLRSLLNSRHTQRGLFSSFKENLKDDRLSHSYQESILNDKEETFVDRVFHWIDDSLTRFFASVLFTLIRLHLYWSFFFRPRIGLWFRLSTSCIFYSSCIW